MVAEQTSRRLITTEDLYRIVYVEDPRISPDGKWIAYVHVSIDRLENTYRRNIWLAPTDGSPPLQLTRGGKDSEPRWSPDGAMLAFTSARGEKPQIYLLRVAAPGGDPRPLTSMENGAQSAAWSPDGRQIAFLAGMNAEERAREDRGEEEPPPGDKLDVRQRSERKAEDEKKRWDPRRVSRIPYREGTAFLDDRYAQIYLIDVAEAEGKEPPRPRRLTNLDTHYAEPAWSPDGQSIITARAIYPERDEPYRWRSVYRINLADGSEEQLNDDSHTCDSVDNAKPSPDGRWIAYLRSPNTNLPPRTTHLAVMLAQGGEPRDLTREFDRPVTVFRWSPDSRWLIFGADNQGNREIYRVSPDGGAVEKIIAGVMEIEKLDSGPDGSVAFAACTPLSPPELFWQAPGVDKPVQLSGHNHALLDEVQVQPPHEMWVTAPDGQPIQAWYILPPGFEEGGRYPLAFNIHGGPHVMWTSSTRSMWHEWQVHAACGYVVLYSNPRGAQGYGEAFADAIHAQWAEPAYTDLMAVVDAILEKGFVDPQRMAVTGGSYGGYMTGWIVGHTDRFACAFSQRGVYNLLSFYGTSDIPFLISDAFDVEPWEDHERLWKWSPLAYAHRITTPLLIKHGDNDYRVPIEQAEQFYATAHRAGAPVEFLRYPRDGHELSRSGEPEHRLSRLNEMVAWFDRYCKPGKVS